MKKILIICLLALTYNITYAQEPTKQDAMNFIAKKFAANFVKPYYYHSYNNGVIQYYKEGFEGKYYSLDLKKLTGYEDIYDCCNGRTYSILEEITGIVLKGKNILLSADGSPKDVWKTVFCDTVNGRYDCIYIINIQQEDNLTVRIRKALDVLIKFNTKSADDKF